MLLQICKLLFPFKINLVCKKILIWFYTRNGLINIVIICSFKVSGHKRWNTDVKPCLCNFLFCCHYHIFYYTLILKLDLLKLFKVLDMPLYYCKLPVIKCVHSYLTFKSTPNIKSKICGHVVCQVKTFLTQKWCKRWQKMDENGTIWTSALTGHGHDEEYIPLNGKSF